MVPSENGLTIFDVTVNSADHPMTLTNCRRVQGPPSSQGYERFFCNAGHGAHSGRIDVRTDAAYPSMKICKAEHYEDPDSVKPTRRIVCVKAIGLMDDDLVPYQ